jgi:branched-chain amino acid transport system permease protein
VSLTNGDNGINLSERPSIFDFSLDSATHFYYLSMLLFALTVINIYLFKHSSLGKSLVGTKVQARRMYAMGYDVWKIRFFSCLYAGLFTSVAGILFFYFNQFISPHALSISASTEALLMIISGGTSAIFGPLVGAALIITIKLIVSAFMDRWNLLLGLTFIFIVILMPNGILPFMQQKFSRNRH